MTTRFWCGACGRELGRWSNRCPKCGVWNQVSDKAPASPNPGPLHQVFEAIERDEAAKGLVQARSAKRWVASTDIKACAFPRIATGCDDFDRVLDGGAVLGGAVLLAGDRGLGKSTLMLATCGRVSARDDATCLYVSGEQTRDQLGAYITRLGAVAPKFIVIDDSDIGPLEKELAELRPKLVVIDSIQRVRLPDVDGKMGGMVQVTECTIRLIEQAQRMGHALFLLAQVTGDGDIAGPHAIEHLVDTVVTFSSPAGTALRLLQCEGKNRFGYAHAHATYEMTKDGLQAVRGSSVPDAAGGMSGSDPDASGGFHLADDVDTDLRGK